MNKSLVYLLKNYIMSKMLEEHRERWEAIKNNIKMFKKSNPTVSQRKIAKIFGTSVGYVNKVLKNLHI